MKAVNALNQEYSEYYSVDLQKDKKVALWVNGLSALISIAMIVPMHFIVPITKLFDMSKGLKTFLIRFAILIVLIFLYIVFHELTHAVAMKMCGTKKVKFGFTALYAYAGSNDYYDKTAYIFIALAPLVLWGIVLGILNCFVSTEWFWVIYFLQIYNVSGAAGDFFVTFKFLRFPKDILIKDTGINMTVYSKQEKFEAIL